jgi:type IV pilus assembly protein PilV
MKPTMARRLRAAQEGVMLLEALIGLLIFSLGVLALVAMQAVSISNVSNAKYRVEASLYAEEIMNYMWLAGDPAQLAPGFSYPGGNSQYLMNWVSRVQSGSMGLPGATTYPPTIIVGPPQTIGPPGPNQIVLYQVDVRLNWKAPDALTPSNHVATTFISQ